MKSLFVKKKEEEGNPTPAANEHPQENKKPKVEGPTELELFGYHKIGERYIFPAKTVRRWRPLQPEPEPPAVDNLLEFGKIPLDKVVGLKNPRPIHSMKRNKDGVIFLGFRLKILLKDNSIIEGWMPEGDFAKFKNVIKKFGRW